MQQIADLLYASYTESAGAAGGDLTLENLGVDPMTLAQELDHAIGEQLVQAFKEAEPKKNGTFDLVMTREGDGWVLDDDRWQEEQGSFAMFFD